METQTERNSVIHRKARGARDMYDARAMSPSKALRLSLEKSADRLLSMALTVSTVEQVVIPHSDISKETGDDGLLVLLDGRGGECGALKLDLAFLAAIVEVQIKGKVSAGEVDERPVTRTDAAIAAPLIDAVLGGLEREMTAAFSDYHGAAFRFGDRVDDARSMALALASPDYDVFRLTADIGPGAKTGVMTVIMPHLSNERDGPSADNDADQKAFDLRDLAMNAPVTLDAVVARISMPLDRICALGPGAQVPLDLTSLSKTELLGARGHVVARVKLGRLNGFRAVQFLAGSREEATEARPDANRADTSGLQDIGTISADVTSASRALAQVSYAPGASEVAVPVDGQQGAVIETASIASGDLARPDSGFPDSNQLSVQGPELATGQDV